MLWGTTTFRHESGVRNVKQWCGVFAILGVLLGGLPAHGAPTDGQPVLGAMLTEWQEAFGMGKVNQGYGDEWQPVPCSALILYRLQVLYQAGRVFKIAKTWCKSVDMPNDAILRSRASRYFPPNSMSMGTTNGPAGTFSLYYSEAIAPYFPDLVQDCRGNPGKPGTFTVLGDADGWSMSVGSCPL